MPGEDLGKKRQQQQPLKQGKGWGFKRSAAVDIEKKATKQKGKRREGNGDPSCANDKFEE